MVQIGLAEAFEFFESIQFGPHKGEDGLLLVAQIDGGGFGCGKEVYNGQLKEVEVLHLVNLYPAVASALGVVEGAEVGLFKKVFEV